jgi:dTDP-4-amino-4,6-dideoxygalactose transaminase
MQPTRQVTEYLRRRCLGLPWHEFLTEDDVRTVCAALAEAIA